MRKIAKLHRCGITLCLVLGLILYASNALAQHLNVSNTFALFSNVNGSYLGNGASCADFDEDGYDDFTFATSNSGLLFYKNNDGSGSTPVDFGITIDGDIKHALWVDYDRDSDLDLFVTRRFAPCLLFRRDGLFELTDVSAEAGIPNATNWETFGAAFGDYDRDGFADFYVCNYNVLGTVTNYLFHNNGDGTFTNVTLAAGVSNDVSNSFQAAWFDFNNDQWQDLYVINDRIQYPNALYLNNGDGTFSDVSIITNSNLQILAMNVGFGDYDLDGDEDLYVTNGADGNVLLKRNPNNYINATSVTGTAVNGLCWGAQWTDYDNDKFLDLYVTTSTEFDTEIPPAVNHLFHNNAGGAFTSITSSPATNISNAHCNIRGDVNKDGFPDIVTHTTTMAAGVFQTIPNENNWITVKLTGTYSTPNALGAEIHLYTGGDHLLRRVFCGESYLAQHSYTQFFGIGSEVKADSLVIRWPSGLVEKYFDLNPNQHLHYVEGSTLDTDFNVSQIYVCEGDSINVEAPTSGMNVVWNTAETGSNINVSTPGVYSYSILLDSGITIIGDSVEVSTIEVPEINFTAFPTNCMQATDGEIHLNFNSLPDSVLIDNEMVGTENWEITGLGNGYHLITVFADGCARDSTIEISSLEAPTINVNLNEIVCFGEDTEVSITSTPSLAISSILPNSFNPTSVVAGTYEIEVFFENGCISSSTFEVPQPSPLEFEFLTVDADGAVGGSIDGTAMGGTPPYTVQWIGPSGFTSDLFSINDLMQGTYTAIVQDANSCLVMATATIVNTDVQEHQLLTPFLFPNPASQFVYFSLIDEAIISLYTANGKLLIEQSFAEGTHELSVANLPEGVYMVTILDRKGLKSQRIVVTKD
jgi:hypothetical protein